MRFEWPRQLSDQDARDMVALMDAVAANEGTLGFYEPLEPEAGRAIMQQLQVDLERGSVHLLIARAGDGHVIGMLTVARNYLPARRHIVEMRRCVIAPEHRGSFMLAGWKEALEHVRDMGCEMIVIDVRDDGPVDLWRRIGFRDYGRLEDYARKDGRPITGYYLYAYVSEALASFESLLAGLHQGAAATVG